MLERLAVRRHARRLTLLTLVALILGSVPGWSTPAAAQAVIDEDLVDTQAQFATGTFQRTSVNAGVVPLQNGNKPFDDKDGMLQLATAGSLNSWEVSALPGGPIARAGVTTIGNKLFYIGGSTSSAASANSTAAWWTIIDQKLGDPTVYTGTLPLGSVRSANGQWVNDPLTSVKAFMAPSPWGADCDDVPITARSGAAVASFTGSDGKGYIYVIGGEVDATVGFCSLPNLSIPAVQIGTVVTATNDIEWSTGTDAERKRYLPSQNTLVDNEDWAAPTYAGFGSDSLGVIQATASVVTTNGGNTYLYVIGGLASYFDIAANGAQNLVTPAVFYTRLNPADGSMVYPAESATGPKPNPDTVWARGPNVPIDKLYTGGTPPPPGKAGIYGHTAMVAQTAVGTGTSTQINSAIFVTGGFTELPANPGAIVSANSTVFRAKVADNGALTWATDLYTPDPTDEFVNLDNGGRGGPGGIAYGGKLYVIGGVASDSRTLAPLGSAAVGVYNDQLDMLPLFPGSESRNYFFGSGATGNSSVIAVPAEGLGAAVIPAEPPTGATTIDNSAWGYVVGGFGPGGGSSRTPIDQLAIGRIGGTAETADSRRIPDGWYYSKFFNIRLDQGTADEGDAKIVAINWYAGVNRTSNTQADLKVQFRRSRVPACNEAAFTGPNASTATEWKSLDGDTTSDFFTKSDNSLNEVKLADVPGLADPIASCLQFRISMTQNGTTGGVPNAAVDPAASPQLFRLAIQKIKPGDPDLFINKFEIGADASGKAAIFDLEIKNLNGTVLNTIPVTGGQFPVVLCVGYVPPEGDPNFAFTPPAFPIPNTDGDYRVDCAPLFRWIDPSETTPGQVFDLNTKWRINFDGYYAGKLSNQDMSPVLSGFTKVGHYAVMAIIDPYDVVLEGGEGSANNRGENLNSGQPLIRRFTITDSTPPPPDPVEEGAKTIYLPMVLK